MTTKKKKHMNLDLKPDSVEYTSLEEGDKKALKYLVQAAKIYILE